MDRGYGCESPYECDSWLRIFRRFDTNHDGYIGTNDLKRFVRESAFSFGLSSQEADALLHEVDANRDHLVDFPEFCTLMSKAKRLRMRAVMFRAAQMVVPKSSRTVPFSYLQQYNCFPPPIFMILISILEVGIYAYYAVQMKTGISVYQQQVPIDSPLIFDPRKKEEIWRYLTYMFLHAGLYHLVVNVLTQIILGVPLELVHKQWRVALVYLSGVLAGSLLAAVVDPHVMLVGASGGVFALLAAHVAELLVNWSEMEFACVRALALAILIVSDAAVAIYQRYYVHTVNKVSHAAHIAGFLAGILSGVIVLRNFRKKQWERVMWWLALSAFSFLLATLIVFNIAPSIL